ncbi:hypothetical protein C8R45DRAFT_970521, partial [Mycena sanguinolenta]
IIHRPYIRKPTILALSSPNKCTNAVRALINAADVWLHRTQRFIFVHMHTSIFTAAVVLLINLYGAKRAGLPIHAAAELAHADTAIRILKFHETRFQSAGRLWDMLHHLNSWEGSPPPEGKFDELPSIRTQVRASVFPGAPPPPPGPSTAEDRFSMHAPRHFQPVATAQQLVMAMQPSFATATGYDEVTGLFQVSRDWSSTPGISNQIVDEHTQPHWDTAPTTFAELGVWDAYIESMNSVANSWPTNYDPQLAALSLCTNNKAAQRVILSSG